MELCTIIVHSHVLNHHTIATSEAKTFSCAATTIALLHVLFLCYCCCYCMCCSFVIAACVAALLNIAVVAAHAEHDMFFLHVVSPLTVGATFGDPVILH